MSNTTKRLRTTAFVGVATVLSLGQTCTQPNQPPAITVGADQTVDPGVAVMLDGSATMDPDGNPLSYVWSQTGGEIVVLAGADAAVASFTAPVRAADAIYSFQLTVSDGTTSVGSRVVSVTVRAAPPPTVDAGPDQTVDEGDTVALAGTVTGLIASTVWEVSADTGVLLSSVTDPKATFGAPDVDEATPLILTLKATDLGGRVASDSVTINVNTLFNTGLLIPDPSELDLLPQAITPMLDADAPASVSLASKLPPVGSQGNLGSCTSWATAYAGGTYSYKVTTSADVSDKTNQASPTYIYYRVLQLQNSVCGKGTDIGKASNVLVTTGTPSLLSQPYSDQCLTSMPGSAGADRFKIGSYKLLGNDRYSIRNELASGRIVVFGANLYTDFFKPPAGIYYGNGQLLKRGQQHAAHAMAIVGYDDIKGAFLVMNSWSTAWADKGFIWWAYSSIEKLIFVAFSYTPRNSAGPSGGGGSGGGANCKTGYSPAINNSSVCCPIDFPYVRGDGYCYKTPESGGCKTGYIRALNDSTVCCPNAYPYYHSDGKCHKTPPEGDDNCSAGYNPAKNYPSICCPDAYPYYWSDKLCHKTDPSLTCKSGSSRALNDSSICCPNGYPYYRASDNKCTTVNPNPANCSTGYKPAINNTTICCPTGYPYYGNDKLCHKTNPDPANCSTGYSPALNNTTICCPDSYPYYNPADNKCHKTNPNPANCSSGSKPAYNNTTICCPSGYPYYRASDNKCTTVNPNPVTCSTGYAPAVNNTTTCCPTDHPYDGFNGYCYKTPRTSRSLLNDYADAEPQDLVADPASCQGDEYFTPADAPAVAPDGPADLPDDNLSPEPAFQPPGGGEIVNARAYQLLGFDPEGNLNVKLVFEGDLIHPINMTRVTLTDPNGVEVTQSYHAAFGNGYVYFERRDGRQWLPGQYQLEMTGETDGQQEVFYSATLIVDPLETADQDMTAAWTRGIASTTLPIPVGDYPADVTGDNGHPAIISGN